MKFEPTYFAHFGGWNTIIAVCFMVISGKFSTMKFEPTYFADLWGWNTIISDSYLMENWFVSESSNIIGVLLLQYQNSTEQVSKCSYTKLIKHNQTRKFTLLLTIYHFKRNKKFLFKGELKVN